MDPSGMDEMRIRRECFDIKGDEILRSIVSRGGVIERGASASRGGGCADGKNDVA
jgi:hypothetical protein